MPDRLSWASTIGLFILNFGTLDLLVQDYLENNLPPAEFARFKERHFSERIERILNHLRQPVFSAAKREQFEQWSMRLEPIRQIRNHIAHGAMRISWVGDKNPWSITISLPRDLDGSNSPKARHLTFEELLTASRELTDLIEDFQSMAGNWVTDVDIKF